MSTYRDEGLSHYGHSCQRCGDTPPLRRLHVHHKDQDRTNNDISNLEVLCVPCHTAEHERIREIDLQHKRDEWDRQREERLLSEWLARDKATVTIQLPLDVLSAITAIAARTLPESDDAINRMITEALERRFEHHYEFRHIEEFARVAVKEGVLQ